MKISESTGYSTGDYSVTFYINNSKNFFHEQEGTFPFKGGTKKVYIGTLNKNNYLPNIYIDYLCCCDAYHTNEQIDKNIQKLAKIFEVDLEEPS